MLTEGQKDHHLVGRYTSLVQFSFPKFIMFTGNLSNDCCHCFSGLMPGATSLILCLLCGCSTISLKHIWHCGWSNYTEQWGLGNEWVKQCRLPDTQVRHYWQWISNRLQVTQRESLHGVCLVPSSHGNSRFSAAAIPTTPYLTALKVHLTISIGHISLTSRGCSDCLPTSATSVWEDGVRFC